MLPFGPVARTRAAWSGGAIALFVVIALIITTVIMSRKKQQWYHNSRQFPGELWAAYEEGGQQHTTTEKDQQVKSVEQAKRMCSEDPTCIAFQFTTEPETAWTKFIRGPNYKPLSLSDARKLPFSEQSDTNLWLKLS